MHHTVTYHGLHEWYKHSFEHLGWMLLAKQHKRLSKVKNYVQSIKHLQDSLVYKINLTRDQDRRDDLKILLENTEVLLKHASKLVKN